MPVVGFMIEGKEQMKIYKRQEQTILGAYVVGWKPRTTFYPLLQKPIALGFPLRDFTKPDTQLEIETLN
jgi:glycine cleavage system aminomethyltransferase T